MCRKSGLKINADKSKVMVLNGEEGLECVALLNGKGLEHVSELNTFSIPFYSHPLKRLTSFSVLIFP